ncbi:hypothetical protein V2I01_10985 [Micromonospora sp. BRA006-A]|nr:hypothetical protein [Micromonospora sp. BRA006-A]
MAAAEPYRNPDLLRRVAAGDRPTEFRSRTTSYQGQIGRALDGVLSRRTTDARRDLAAALGAARGRAEIQAARQRAGRSPGVSRAPRSWPPWTGAPRPPWSASGVRSPRVRSG